MPARRPARPAHGVVLFLLSIGLASVLAGQPLGSGTARAVELPSELADAVTAYVETELASLAVPGAAVVITDRESIVYARGFGEARDGVPATPQTPFHIASVTKSLTALAVMQLVESGQIDLDATVATYLPSFAASEVGNDDITVRDLLAHTSGWTEHDGLANWADSDASDTALGDNVDRLAATPPTHARGEFEYSNGNYDTLGRIVEVVSGRTYEAYMTDAVLGPLDMAHTWLNPDDAEADGLAQGHYRFLGVVLPWETDFVRSSLPSGFVMSSAEDLGHALIAHLNDGRYEGASVLSAEGIRTLHQPRVYPDGAWNGYASGLWVNPLWTAGALTDKAAGPGYEVPVHLEHGGDHSTFASQIYLLPVEEWGVVVLLNANDIVISSKFHQIQYGIASILLGREPMPSVVYEDLFLQNAKTIALVVIGLQVLGILWAMRRLRIWRADPAARPVGPWPRFRHAWLPLVVDFGVPLLFLWLVMNSGLPPYPDVVLSLLPDVFLILLVMSLLGFVWGVIRAIATSRILGSETPEPASSAAPA